MAKRKWIFLSNTFEVQTRGSHRKMLSLATDTHSKLMAENSDPVISGIFMDIDPVFEAFVVLYAHHRSAAGIRKGHTLNVETLLLEDLHHEIRRWEGAVRSVYPEGSPKEVEMFPRKRTPFFHGRYEQRITTIASLAEKLTADPSMTTVALQVQSFYNMLLSAREMQLQKDGLLAMQSNLLENQRKLLAEALWGIVLGRLMDKYRRDPSQIERFFDFILLRKRRKKNEGEVEALKAA